MKRKRGYELSAVSDYADSLLEAVQEGTGEGESKAKKSENLNGDTQASVDGEWQDVDRAAKRKLKKLAGSYPAITHANNAKLNSFVKISDLQNLALYLLADAPAPQWVSVRHHHNFDKVVVLMIPGLDARLFDGSVPLDDLATNGNDDTKPKQQLSIAADDYFPSKLATQKLPPALRPLTDIFSHIWPIKTPGDYRRIFSPMYAMLSVPIPRTKEEKSMKGPKPPAEGKGWKNIRTPITEFVATRAELAENGFAIHPAHLTTQAELDTEAARRHRDVQSPLDGWIDMLDIKTLDEGRALDSDIESGSILQGRQLLVMDCEMVTTTQERFSLARISVVDWDGNVVLDELVKQTAPVKDYLTPYSGITAEMLATATLTLPDIQMRLRSLVTPQTILAGHSLDSDLRAVKIAYPFVVDSTLLYPHPKGPPQKSSLKWLTAKYLARDIQNAGGSGGSAGHDSVEDARACLDLIRQKCEKGKAWGTAEAQGEPIFKRLARTGSPKTRKSAVEGNKVDNHDSAGRTGALVDWSGGTHGFGASAAVTIACNCDQEVVAGVIRAVNGANVGPAVSGASDAEADGSRPASRRPHIPNGGCDLTFARLRSLEFARGWSPAPAPLSGAVALDEGGGDTAGLVAAVRATVSHVSAIYDALPPRTALIAFSGSGDPRDLLRMQALHAAHKAEFLTTKWDQLTTKWTDVEEQALRRATEVAKRGVGFIAVSRDDNLWALRQKEREGAARQEAAAEPVVEAPGT